MPLRSLTAAWLLSLLAMPLCAQTATKARASAAAHVPAQNCVAPAPAPRTGPTYLLTSQLDILALLPPPPAPDSAAQRDDLQAVLQAQRAARADGALQHAIDDVQTSCARFADAVGDALTSPEDASVLEFLNHAAREGSLIVGPAKRYWKRTRPYAYSHEVEPQGDMSPSWKSKPDIDTAARAPMAGAAAPNCLNGAPMDPAQLAAQQQRAADELAHSSYPSGHSTFGTVCALLLADMVPEKREQVFTRLADYGHSRLVMGAHFPSDIQGGRIGGTLAAELMMQNAKFQHDYSDARATLRRSLGLPPETPNLEPSAP